MTQTDSLPIAPFTNLGMINYYGSNVDYCVMQWLNCGSEYKEPKFNKFLKRIFVVY